MPKAIRAQEDKAASVVKKLIDMKLIKAASLMVNLL